MQQYRGKEAEILDLTTQVAHMSRHEHMYQALAENNDRVEQELEQVRDQSTAYKEDMQAKTANLVEKVAVLEHKAVLESERLHKAQSENDALIARVRQLE